MIYTELFDEFRRSNIEFDLLRDEKFAEVFPELAEL